MNAVIIDQKRSFLYDGSAITVRPAQPSDAILLQEMHQRLSPNSVQLRYFRPYTPSFAELEKLCNLSEEHGAAYVATVESVDGVAGETVIGMAYYIVEDAAEKSAEVAFLIEDRFQGQGLGRKLFYHLSQHAKEQNIHELTAHVHPSNGAMMQIFRKGGYPLEATYAYGEREVHIHLDAAPTYRFSVN